ncbi:unnamed protein product [Sphenostylis stenocarpa]|uniref:Uncharacterized protein n=1 Tax=Sphenostylis stenocarpa TaxID=92480 RepID=A0AA86V328_9FABA|nr:unnamed protein product [Sphenostylis stenocarpa]
MEFGKNKVTEFGKNKVTDEEFEEGHRNWEKNAKRIERREEQSHFNWSSQGSKLSDTTTVLTRYSKILLEISKSHYNCNYT